MAIDLNTLIRAGLYGGGAYVSGKNAGRQQRTENEAAQKRLAMEASFRDLQKREFEEQSKEREEERVRRGRKEAADHQRGRFLLDQLDPKDRERIVASSMSPQDKVAEAEKILDEKRLRERTVFTRNQPTATGTTPAERRATAIRGQAARILRDQGVDWDTASEEDVEAAVQMATRLYESSAGKNPPARERPKADALPEGARQTRQSNAVMRQIEGMGEEELGQWGYESKDELMQDVEDLAGQVSRGVPLDPKTPPALANIIRIRAFQMRKTGR